MRILGISAYYHDSAAALVEDGRVVAAAQEERFTRRKHDAGFPHHAIRYCLEEAGRRPDDIDRVVFYDDNGLKFRRLLATYLSFAPKGFASFEAAMPVWLGGRLRQRRELAAELARHVPDRDWNRELLFVRHHESHAASAFYPSPFETAAILVMDGVGEWATTSLALGRGDRMEMIREIRFPHSLGLLYSAFTYFLGFKVNSGEYKVMGLAPYGAPVYKSTILERLIDLKPDGSFWMDQSYFDYCTGLRMVNERFCALFGGPPRRPDEPLTQRHMDLAASVQAVCEDVVLRLARSAAEDLGLENLCLAGGVALNCVANGKVLRDGRFKRLWIQPAAGDAGGALGAALLAHHRELGQPRRPTADRPGGDGMAGAYLGPAYADAEIRSRLEACGARFTALETERLLDACVDDLCAGKAVGWFQGRMEFGPRALGARSILGDPRSPAMQSTLNLKVKYRESFRPFAPAVLRENAAEWFDLDVDSPYMLLVADVAERRRIPMTPDQERLFGIEKLNVPRSSIPAVTHVDHSARVQTVHPDTNPLFHALLVRFRERTGCPVLVNTSFNVRGEPIVCSPEDAFRCFMGTEIETLAVGGFLLRKEDQDPALRRSTRDQFELD